MMNFGSGSTSGRATIRATRPGRAHDRLPDYDEMLLDELVRQKERNRRAEVYAKRVAAGLPIEYDPADFDDGRDDG